MADRLAPAEKPGNQAGADSAPNTSMIDEVFHSGKDFAKTAVYTALCEPFLGVSQIVDKTAGTHSMDTIGSAFSSVGLTAPEQPTGALDHTAQMFGSAVGMVAPYLLLHKAVRAGAIKAFGEDAIASRTDLSLMGKSSFASFTAKEAGLSFATGMGYNGIFRPSDDSKQGLSFVADRALNGTIGGTTMAALTASSLGLAKLGTSEAVQAPWQKTILTNPMSTNVISAIPAGLAGSEVTALRNGKLKPTVAEATQNIYQMGFTGLALGAAGFLGAPHEASGRTNFQHYISDRIGSQSEVTTATNVGKTGESVEATDATARKTGESAIAPETTVAKSGDLPDQPVMKPNDVTTAAKISDMKPMSIREAMAQGELSDIESPVQRAIRLDRVKNADSDADDFEQSKNIFFAKLTLPDGTQKDVVLRPVTGEKGDLLRIYSADRSDRINNVVAGMANVNFETLPLILRDNVTLPVLHAKDYTIIGSKTGPAMVQENGGTQLGTLLKYWARADAVRRGENSTDPGVVTTYLHTNSDARALIGRAVFDNMYKGNVDLLELSQQTVPDAQTEASVQPTPDLPFDSIDSKNDFSNLSKPSWGFGAQFGLSLEVAKALEEKSLSEVSPKLADDAQAILNVYSSEEGMAKLRVAGLTDEEIVEARNRLQSLVRDGFPKHLGTSNYYADEAEQQLTASLNTEYDTEGANVRDYLTKRNEDIVARGSLKP